MSELIKIEEFTALIQSAPSALTQNKNSIMACNNAGQGILDTIEGEGMNDELDAKAAEYLKKVGITIKNMQIRRSPITQIFDRIRSVFTSDEKAIDPKDGKTIPGKIAYARDQYATKKRAEEKKRQEEATRLANIAAEKSSYKLQLENAILDHMNGYFQEQSEQLSNMWNTLSVNSFDLKAKIIKEWPLVYPKSHFDKFTKDFVTYNIEPRDKGAIKAEVFNGKYEAFASQYKFDMEDLKRYYIDRLPSKKQELLELETLRIANPEEAVKVTSEMVVRESQEQQQRNIENLQKLEERKVEQTASAQTEQMSNLFNMAAASAEATITMAPVKAKVTERIKVLHTAGFVEIYQMWWVNEGQNLTIEELEKVHKKMITFCEKKANKDDVKIQSKYIRYEEEVKAK